ncbi:MAG: hypothetical protein KME46_17180 [Brasilonema angustatum HA4187-MV1]|nr:hypothetical protein [Brasilonema angustatum HA4187-MV1]
MQIVAPSINVSYNIGELRTNAPTFGDTSLSKTTLQICSLNSYVKTKSSQLTETFEFPAILKVMMEPLQMKRRETLAELVARTVVEFEQRELQNTQVYYVQSQGKSTLARKSKKAA